MFFGKKKKKREGALEDSQIRDVIQTLSVNDGATVERINWDGSTTIVSGRVSHVGTNFEDFILVEEGSGEGVHFRINDGDISKIQRVAISIDLDEHHEEAYMPEETIIELLEAEIGVVHPRSTPCKGGVQRGRQSLADPGASPLSHINGQHGCPQGGGQRIEVIR